MKHLHADDLVWVGLGGNLGDVHHTCDEALRSLSNVSSAPLTVSDRYISEPWGLGDQPRFLNQVVGLKAHVDDPIEMMTFLHELEAAGGRDRSQETRWGPRFLDLDLLCWPRVAGTFGTLNLPHPRLHLRRFVLQPWSEVAPDLIPFGLTETVEMMLRRCEDSGHIERYPG